MKKQPLIVNFFGAPGAGKSTMAAAVFAKLKLKGISCELVDEYVKGAVWEKRTKIIHNQLYLLSKQYQKLARIDENVDIIITDSPIMLNIFYNRLNAPEHNFDEKVFNPMVLECHNKFKNLNFFVKRNFEYELIGRVQTEDEADKIEKKLIEINKDYNIKCIDVASYEETATVIANKLAKILKKKK